MTSKLGEALRGHIPDTSLSMGGGALIMSLLNYGVDSTWRAAIAD